MVLAGILVGFLAGFAGLLLKILVRQVQYFVANKVPFEGRLLVFALFPMLGIVLTVLIVKYMFRGKEDKEFSDLFMDVSKRRSKMRKTKMY